MNNAIKKVAEAILANKNEEVKQNFPDKTIVCGVISKMQCILFREYFGLNTEYALGAAIEDVSRNLEELIPSAQALEFINKITVIREYLLTDIEAAYEGDPAAYSKAEIVISYPGIFAVMVQRMAHELYILSVPLIPRIMTEYAHSITGIDIHPGAKIGKYFFIDHGTGTVIGETTVIGNHVKIYQGVTLGALSTRGGQSLKGVKRHPTIEDYVTIYSGASILGGNTVIGENTVIGSNAFVTKSVPDKTKVSVKNPELQFKNSEKVEIRELVQDEFWDYII